MNITFFSFLILHGQLFNSKIDFAESQIWRIRWIMEQFVHKFHSIDPCFIYCYESTQNFVWIILKYRQFALWIIDTSISNKAFYMQSVHAKYSSHIFTMLDIFPQFYFTAIHNNTVDIFSAFWSWCLNWMSRTRSIIGACTLHGHI